MPQTDADLVTAFQKGREAAFDRLVERHGDGVYQRAVRMLGVPDDALDATQEVFLKVYRSLQQLRDQDAFRGWLKTATVRTCLTLRNRRKRRRDIEQLRAEQATEKTEPCESNRRGSSPETPSRAAEQEELREQVRGAIDRLPASQREAVLLRDIEGLTYDQITEVLKIPRGTVMSRIHYGRAKLRDLFQHTFQNGESP